MKLDGRTKAAVLVLALGPEAAADALRCMSPASLQHLAKAVSELERQPIPPEAVDAVLGEFRADLERRAQGVAGHQRALRDLLGTTLGPERGEALLQELERERRAENPFQDFAELEPGALAQVLEGELPQVQALVLANVPASTAAAVLAERPEDERLDLLLRLARTEDVSPELAVEVGAALGAGRAARRKGRGRGPDPSERLRRAANVLNELESDEEGEGSLLERLREVDEGLAEKIEEQMFVFDDVAQLDARSLQKVLSQIEGRVLAMALKACDEVVAEKLLGNLSKRARQAVIEEKELLGPQPLAAVQEAQAEITSVVRSLIHSGQLTLQRGKEAQLVE
ncbi:MAG: hypothetical protein D6731_20375 [Planctomycetota bacterium]|nr:MAG: hypothetical protein D6731_20375 [Planctomycetota bacterium]